MRSLPYIAVIGLFSLLLLLSLTAQDEQAASDKEYCEMVKIGIETNGEYGWPDFRKSYARDCQ